MTQTPPPSDPGAARLHFRTKELEVEFEGRPDFITAQIEHMKPAIERELQRLAKAAEPAAAPAETSVARDPPGTPSLEEFHRRARSREGRGALQETILIFAYFLREFRGKEEFGIENLTACFSLVGITPPKSLANTLGIMKRTQRFFAAGARRGQYSLTEQGVAYVKRLVGAP
jgi:hypothetical protein